MESAIPKNAKKNITPQRSCLTTNNGYTNLMTVEAGNVMFATTGDLRIAGLTYFARTATAIADDE